MKLTIVGCAGSFAGPHSAASCYLVQAPDALGRVWNIAVELGSGAFGPLQHYVDPRDLDAILLTHLHADHCADMSGAEVYFRYHPDGYAGPKVVYAPGETWGAQMAPYLGGCDPSDAVGPAFCPHHWGDRESITIGPFVIESAVMNHPVPTYGLRITGPRHDDACGSATMAYSADTDECPALQHLSREADLLLCEAAFLDGRDAGRGMHLTPSRAALGAREANVRHLVLTHIQPWTDPEVCRAAAAQHFPGPLDVAVPGSVYFL